MTRSQLDTLQEKHKRQCKLRAKVRKFYPDVAHSISRTIQAIEKQIRIAQLEMKS